MTDYELSCRIWEVVADLSTAERKNLHKTHEIIIDSNMNLRFEPIGTTPKYRLKANKEIAIEIPKSHDTAELQTATIALAVGRRLERFERGRKANATRTPNSRKEIAQNAIQARWSAK